MTAIPSADSSELTRPSAVGDTPQQPVLAGLSEDDAAEEDDTVDLNVEVPEGQWSARIVGEAPARPDEHPVRFIDGSLSALPVLCLRAPQGWSIPLLVSEAGAVALRLAGRSFEPRLRDRRACAQFCRRSISVGGSRVVRGGGLARSGPVRSARPGKPSEAAGPQPIRL